MHVSRITKGNNKKTGRPNRYAGLKRRDNNQERLSNAQDDVYSEIQESRFSSISGNLHSLCTLLK